MKKQQLLFGVLLTALCIYGCNEDTISSEQQCKGAECDGDTGGENPDAKDSKEGDNNTTDHTKEEDLGAEKHEVEDPEEVQETPCNEGDEDCANVKQSCDICVANSLRCVGSELQICKKNADDCLDWAVQENCAASGGKCDRESLKCVECAEKCTAGEKKCAVNGIAECVPDADGCAAWNTTEVCQEGMTCDEATVQCVPGCTNECQEGETKCGGTEIYGCQKEESGCFVWKLQETCEFGKICVGNPAKCDYACGDDCEPFSLIMLPDTQNYTRTNNGIYKKQTDWIVKNQKKENIRFIMHMGDVTNDNTNTQFKRAIAAHDVLAKAGIPYSIATGNHEYKKGDSGQSSPGHSRTLFGKYFNDKYIKDGYKDSSWFHGFYSTGNMYATFEVGNLKFAVIALEYAPRKDVLCWADNLIQTELKDRYVIITTHGYLTRGATKAEDGKYSGGGDIRYTTLGATGGEVFSELAARHSNVIIAAGGHVCGVEHRYRAGYNGNQVHESLVDYQCEKPCSGSSCPCAHAADAGNGWLHMLTIDPKNKKTEDGKLVNNVSAKTVSVLDSYQKKGKMHCSSYYSAKATVPNHTYEFALDFSKPIDYKYTTDNNITFNIRSINDKGAGNQYVPAIAVNRTTGAFVAVWQDDSNKDDGDGNYDIEGRIFCAGGCEDVKQFTVNSNTAGSQRHPDVAMDKDGNFVVVWEEDNGNKNTSEIYMRGFDAKGNERFASKVVNTVTDGMQYTPSIAMAPDGKFVVAWHDESAGQNTPQVFIRGFNADGSELFHDRNVMEKAEGARKAPDVAIADDGTFVVTWQDDSDGNGTYQIYAKGFNADGTDRISQFTVNTVAAGQQYNPSIGMNASGTFFIAYEDDNDKNGKFLIMARGFDKDGKEIFKDTTLAGSGENAVDPVVCVADSNKAVFGWTAKALNANDIQRRVVSSEMKINEESKVNRISDGPQNSPALGCTAEGKHIFLFSDDNDKNSATEIFGRGYNG